VNFSLFMIVAMSILDSLGLGSIDWVFLLILVIIGLIVIVLIRLFLVLIPAILVALLVWFLTGGDLFWTGVAFLVVALLSLIARI
jgi:hypothetical protein